MSVFQTVIVNINKKGILCNLTVKLYTGDVVYTKFFVCRSSTFFFLHQITPLHLAAESGHIKMVNCLVEQGADTNIQDNNGVIKSY